MVEIPLPPGRHEVTVRAGFVGSQPVGIEAGPGEVYHLKVVRTNMAFWRRERLLVFILAALAPLAIQFINIACGYLFSDRVETGWLGRFTVPMVMLPSLVLFAVVGVSRDHLLALEEVPPLDPADRRVMLPEVPPLRLRITIRGMMVAMAVLAVVLGGTIQCARFTRREFFQREANRQVQLEAQFRGFEQEWVQRAADEPKTGKGTGFARRFAAKTAAKADYHAAMKRKYEEAAARGAFSVEPDPPAPPWP
jgi:hypothetical protein